MVTPTVLSGQTPQSDFSLTLFENLVKQKGRTVRHEKTLLCPCKSVSAGQKSDCKNCGGSGWIYAQPKEYKMVISNADIQFKLNELMVETKSVINISCSNDVQLAYDDRIILLDSISWYNQELKFYKNRTNQVFAKTFYPIKEIDIIALFDTSLTPLNQLSPTDYTIVDSNTIHLSQAYINAYPTMLDSSNAGYSGTIRYSHNPHYIVTEIKRESMEQYNKPTDISNGDEALILQHFPIAAIGSKMHDVRSNPSPTNTLITNTFISNSNGCK